MVLQQLLKLRVKDRENKTKGEKTRELNYVMGKGRSQKEQTPTEAMKTDPKPHASCSVLIHNSKGDMD